MADIISQEDIDRLLSYGKPAAPSAPSTPQPTLDELLSFKEKNGYAMGFNSKTEYDQWIASKTKPKVKTTELGNKKAVTEEYGKSYLEQIEDEMGYKRGFLSGPNPFEEELKTPSPKAEPRFEPKAEPIHTAKVPTGISSEIDEVIRSKAKASAAEAIRNTNKSVKRVGGILGGLVATATILDVGMNMQDHARMNKQVNIQRKQEEQARKEGLKFDKDTYYSLEELNGLPQQLYGDRNNHSNSWGGRRY